MWTFIQTYFLLPTTYCDDSMQYTQASWKETTSAASRCWNWSLANFRHFLSFRKNDDVNHYGVIGASWRITIYSWIFDPTLFFSVALFVPEQWISKCSAIDFIIKSKPVALILRPKLLLHDPMFQDFHWIARRKFPLKRYESPPRFFNNAVDNWTFVHFLIQRHQISQIIPIIFHQTATNCHSLFPPRIFHWTQLSNPLHETKWQLPELAVLPTSLVKVKAIFFASLTLPKSPASFDAWI